MYRIYPYYIKKEDAKDILKGQKITLTICLGGMAIVFGIMTYFVLPKLTGIYSEMGIDLPIMTQYLVKYISYIIGLFALSIIYILSPNNFLNSGFEEKLSKYKAGEMIKTSRLVRRDIEWIVMIAIFAMMGFLVISIIQPIYSITQNF